MNRSIFKSSMSRIALLKERAKQCGLSVATYSPGDGVTRYRFFRLSPREPQDYSSGGGITTQIGIKEAEIWLSGFEDAVGVFEITHLARSKRRQSVTPITSPSP